MARFLLLVLAVLWTIHPSEAAERRVALVVGAATYQHAPALAHSLDDARDMAAALKRLGFDVDLVLDPDRGRLENAVRRLGQRARGADAALFFYSGHALESQGINWVLPVSADVQEDRDLRFEALDLTAVLGQIEGAARVSLIFLDACRDDPFKQRLGASRAASRSGLATVNATLSGTYLAFATAPGVIAADGDGPHSPFTGALLKYIEVPGLELRQMMSKVRSDVEEATSNRQVPWDSSSLKGDFYFNPANAGKVSESVLQAINGPGPQVDLDAIFWESVDKKKPADLNAYLAKFPQGTFAELARNRLAELKAAPVGTTPPANRNLVDALSAVLPSFSEKQRQDDAAAYQDMKGHKALAASPSIRLWQRVSLRSSALEAEESALEACEVGAGAPCLLIAVDDEVRYSSGSAPRPMPRAQYAGKFDPERIPSIQIAVRQRPDVAGYLAAPSPKAAAYSTGGKLFVVSAAANQHDAEENVLSSCGDDAKRNGGSCFLYASGNDVVLARHAKSPVTLAQQEPFKPPLDPAALKQKLQEALAGAAPSTSVKYREDAAAAYQADGSHKAMATYPASGMTWRSPARPTALDAQDSVLEACEVHAGAPCVLIAVDDDVRFASDSTPRFMPRVHYAGTFNPENIPSVQRAVRERPDVQGYLAATRPKAAAYNPGGGKLFIVTGAASLRAAEASALSACGDDATRSGSECFLYASNNEVVLPRRSKAPITAEVAVPPPDPPKPPPLHEVIAAQIEKLVPAMAPANRDSLAQAFEDGADHKAMAMHQKNAGSWRLYKWPSAETVEEAALEGCQAYYGEPCALLAVDNEIRLGGGGAPVIRDMPRIRYAGTFTGEQLPAVKPAMRIRADVKGYGVAKGFKAAAFHPWGEVYTVTGAANQNEAETKALSDCNGAPGRAGKGGPCYLYASGDQVVFPKRLRLAMTPAPAPTPAPPPPPAPTPPPAPAPQPVKKDTKDVPLRPLGKELAAVLAKASVPNAADRASYFDGLKAHKSMLLVQDRQIIWNFNEFTSAEAVERVGLEACGLAYNTACVALVVDDNIKVNAPSNAKPRTMPRLAYQGPYKPENVPLFATVPKVATEYVNMPAPKAMALGPKQLKIAAETGATLAEAQAKALAKCTNPESPFPCFIYAVNDQVILPQRRTEPVP